MGNSKQCLLEPLKDQNKKRVLQALAGTDIEESSYISDVLPMKIPTQTLNL